MAPFYRRAEPLATQNQRDFYHGLLVVGANDSTDLRTIDSQGREQRVFVSAGTGVPVTDAMVSEKKEQLIANLQADLNILGLIPPAQLMPIIESQKNQIMMIHARATAPGFEELIIDGEARVWLAEPKASTNSEQRWRIVDLRVGIAAEAQFKPSGTILDAKDGFLLTVEKDDLDRELVRLYSLTEEAPQEVRVDEGDLR